MSEIDPAKLEKELAVMREMIQTDQEVLNHFDTNGDGEIDGDEWDAVQDLVVKRLNREARELEAAKAAMAGVPRKSIRPDSDPEAPPIPLEPGETAQYVFREDLVPMVQTPRGSGTTVDLQEALLLDILVLKRGGEFRGVSTKCDVEYALFNKGQKQLCRLNLTRDRGRSSRKHRGVRVDIIGPDGAVTHTIRHGDMGDEFMVIEDAEKRELGRLSRRSTWLRRVFDMTWPLGQAIVRRSLWDETAHVVVDAYGTDLARVEQDWSGLGGLFNNDLMHMAFEPAAELEARWAILGTAVLLDVYRRR